MPGQRPDLIEIRTKRPAKTLPECVLAPDVISGLQSILSLMNGWSSAISGGGAELTHVLQALNERFNADTSSVFRRRESWTGPRLVARARGAVRTMPCPGLVDIVTHKYRSSARPGTIWRLSELRDEPGFANTAAARELEAEGHIEEISIVVLENRADQFDFLKVGYLEKPDYCNILRPDMIGRALAEGWSMRRAGLIGQLINENTRRNRAGTAHLDELPPILSDANPYGLSRSEFRVCHLLERGLKAPEIADELGLAEATIRSHLGAIYAKTGASGALEVMSRLHQSAMTQKPRDEAPRRAAGA